MMTAIRKIDPITISIISPMFALPELLEELSVGEEEKKVEGVEVGKEDEENGELVPSTIMVLCLVSKVALANAISP